jgi:glycogen debranching enzyme
MFYIVTVKELYQSKFRVEADSPKEARQLADSFNGEFVKNSTEFVDTLQDDSDNVIDGRYEVDEEE